MSFFATGNVDAFETAVKRVIADGVVVVAGAGNDGRNPCDSVSPARMADVITVAASTKTDAFASYSNSGPCVDIIAPGTEVAVADQNATTGGTVIGSGTSLAAPMVAGAAAMILAGNPTLTPAQVTAALLGAAARGKITGIPKRTCRRPLLGLGCTTVQTPNRLLQIPGASVATTPKRPCPWLLRLPRCNR